MKNTSLHIFMAGSLQFSRGFGSRKLKLITDQYPQIMKHNWSTQQMQDNIMKIKGFDTITATQFATNFNNFVKYFNSINKVFDISYILEQKKDDKYNKIWKNKKIVFTGFRDKKLQKLIENNGGVVTTSVSGNTNLVIYVENKDKQKSAKLTEAIKKGIVIIDKDKFIKKYKY